MVEPLLVSLCYFAYILLLCEIGRSLSRAFIREASTLSLVEEFLGTVQLCSLLFENGFVLSKFGLAIFAVTLFSQCLMHAVTLRGAYANPCPIFEQFFNGRVTSSEFVSKTACQLAAAFLSFRVAKLFWTLHMTEDHRSAYANFFCSSNLQVSIFVGFCCEMFAAFVYRLGSLKLGKYFQPRISMILESVLIVSLVLLGLNYTGMYFNPILATANTYGCRNEQTASHVIVYWLGPIVGWMTATRAHHVTGGSYE